MTSTTTGRSRHAAAWITMGGAGATGMAYNLYRSLHGGPGNVVLAVLLGIMPMTLAMLLTHVVGDAVEAWMRRAVLAVMVAAMGLSLSATASVVAPGPGIHYRAYGFGLVLDAASLLAFRVIMSARAHEDAAAAAVIAAEARAREAISQLAAARASAGDAAAAAAGRAAAMKEELAAARAEAASQATAAAAELATARTELEAVRTALQDRSARDARTGPRTAARTGPGSRSRTGPRTDRTASKPPAADDVSLQAAALMELAAKPDIKGPELAARLGVTEGYARKLKRQLTQPDRPADAVPQSRAPGQDGP